jgi:hypothetical protein
MERVLVPHLVAVLLGNELRFFALVVRNLDLEIRVNLAGSRVIKTVEKRANDSESLRNDATNLARVIAGLTALDCQVDDANTTER